MKFEEAKEFINDYYYPGYVVMFQWIEGDCLQSDYFPDIKSGDAAIESEEEAWKYASSFAAAMMGKVVNVYVARKNLTPVDGYEHRKLLPYGD